MLDKVYLSNSIQRWLVAAGILLGALLLGRIVSMVIKAIGSRLKSPFLTSITAGVTGPLISGRSLNDGRSAYKRSDSSR